MNFKKLAFIFTASLMTVFSLNFSAFADDETAAETESDEVIAEDEASEYLTTEDGNYQYSVATDEDTNEQYVILETYLGTEESVVIPEEVDGIKVREIGDYTFCENMTIKDVTIPKTVEDFGDYCFYGCTSLTEYKVDEENEIYTTDENGALVAKDGLVYFLFPAGNTSLSEITVPDGTVSIHSSAFAVCRNFKKINLPDSLEYIGSFCFGECESLDNVVIPEGVTSIEQFTFSGCKSLKNITLPDTITYIGSAAFFECTSLTDFTFPAQLTEIDQAAFASTGFDSIEIPPTIQSIGYSAFGFTTDENNQIVPMESFTVKGYTGSVAQSYCSENEIEFVAIEEEATTEASSSESKNSSDSKVKPGVIISICIVAVVIVIVVVVIVRKSRKNYDDDNENDDDYDSDSDNDEEDSSEDDKDDENEPVNPDEPEEPQEE